ncbi:hypothetical protein DDE18_14250 [Nocardioides gansuensis]|uniref:Uncharacterized protein n=1 Tax=Nocardioides gansuensis TaxID=2138300 RepID=A0A2T8F852_9ACTN|nr:hypothetical protein [Nocardioides gansuensis]PVG81879.1 hypothetical protein DDE18_14250 [Nocardioides gansuensis]
MTKALALSLVLLAAVACGGDGLEGRSVLVDDTGLGDASDGGGWMLVLPAERAPDLWAEVGEPDDLRRASFTLDQAAAEGLGGTLAEVDGDGDYALDATGPTLLCRLPEEANSRGCAEIDLPTSGTVVTSFGEGGFNARVED